MIRRGTVACWCAAALLLAATGSGCGRTEGVDDVRKRAGRGDAKAQYDLGVSYARMHDGAEAVQWFRKAADQGNVDAQNSLAFMYITGQGVRQDDAEASRWYRKAADQGNADAQYNLGVLYAKGRGVAQDYLLAQVWVNLALSRTLTDKRSKWMETRDIITKKMTSAQIAEAQRLVLEWKPKEQR